VLKTGERFWIKNGTLVGASTDWHAVHLVQMTDEVVLEIRREQALNYLRGVSWSQMSDVVLFACMDVIHSAREKTRPIESQAAIPKVEGR
jgi:hypothetical protein